MNPSMAPTLDDLEQAYKTHDANLAGHQQAEAVVTTAAGIAILCSTNPKGEGEHTWLLHLGSDGTLQWERHLDARLGTGRALAALPGGGYAVTGDVQLSQMEYQGRALHLGGDGEPTATATGGGRGATGFTAVTVLPDGSMVAGGTTRWKGWLVRFDAALRVAWEQPLTDVEEITGLTALDDGGFAAAANQEKPTTGLGVGRVIAWDGDGSVRWQRRLPARRRGELAAVAALPDNGLMVVGHSAADEQAKARLWVTRLDPSGEVMWERMLGKEMQEQRGRALVVLPDGGVAVVGDAVQGLDQRSIQVARLAGDGTLLWEKAFGGEHTDVARGIARTEDGGLVVVGSTMSKGPGKTNAWVLHLDGHGTLRWDRAFGFAG